MAFENRASVGALSGMSSAKWLNGVVQSVSNFGIFVRPAGYEMTGKCNFKIINDVLFLWMTDSCL